MQNEEIKEKVRKTNLKRYGTENPLSSKEVQEKVKQTNLKRYGVENPKQSEQIQEKYKQTCLKKYGVESYNQTEESRKYHRSMYYYNKLNFDSKVELAFYIYCRDQNLPIQRCSKKFEYYFEGKKH